MLCFVHSWQWHTSDLIEAWNIDINSQAYMGDPQGESTHLSPSIQVFQCISECINENVICRSFWNTRQTHTRHLILKSCGIGTFTPGLNFTGLKIVPKKKDMRRSRSRCELARHVFASHLVQRLAAQRPISYSERSIAWRTAWDLSCWLTFSCLRSAHTFSHTFYFVLGVLRCK